MHDEELGIPGHASHSDAIKRFQRFLRTHGYSFEAEGDMTRIHIDGALVELTEEPARGYVLMITIPLPRGGEPEAEIYRPLRALAFFVSNLGASVSYELDTGIPDYPLLRAKVFFTDLETLLNALYDVLEKYVEDTD